MTGTEPAPAARWLAIPAGLAVSALVLCIGGFIVVVAGCDGDLGRSTSWLCTRWAPLVTPLELCLLALGTFAPITGAIATVIERQARWIGYGVLAGAAIFILLLGLSGEQASLLSG